MPRRGRSADHTSTQILHDSEGGSLMVASSLVLIPGAGGVGRAVFEQLRAQDVPVRFMQSRRGVPVAGATVADQRRAESRNEMAPAGQICGRAAVTPPREGHTT